MAKPWYITVYSNYWGRGHTPEESKKEARKAGGRGRNWVTKELPKYANNPYVSDMGQICWTWSDGAPSTVEATFYLLKVIKHGTKYKIPERL